MSEFVEQSNSPLHAACDSGDIEQVKELLGNGADINESDADGNKPLHKATLNGKMEVALELLEKGADLLSKGKDGMTALHFACAEGHKDLALAFVEQGADSICKNNSGLTPSEVAKDDDLRDAVNNAVSSRKKSRTTNRIEEEMNWRLDNAKPVVIEGMDGRAAETVNGTYTSTGETSCGWPVYSKTTNSSIELKYVPDPTPAEDSPAPPPNTWTIYDGEENCVAKTIPPRWTPPGFPGNLPAETEWEVYNPGRLMGMLAARPKRKTCVRIKEGEAL